jgi:hypothetical protein
MTCVDEKIEPIHASWYRGDAGKSDVYRLLNMTHVMACYDSQFRLSRTCTDESYALTVWTNGIVDIGAETHRDYLGDVLSHHYWLCPARENDDD